MPVTVGAARKVMGAVDSPADWVASIVVELRALRKGRGLNAPDLHRRLGANLRALTASEGHPVDHRKTLVTELNLLARPLPGDLRTAIAASLGLSADTRQMAHFSDRTQWLAARLGVGVRTALRRIADAERLLAEQVAEALRDRSGRTPTAPHGWYLEEFRVLVRLDTPTLEVHEHRRIAATQDGLTEVMAWHNVPGTRESPRPTPECEALYGCRLIRRVEPEHHRFQFVVQLPRPLAAGDRHEYALLLRMPEGERIRPHYIFTPECACEQFNLRVRADPDRQPRWIRRVDGETVRMFENGRMRGRPLELDGSGEIYLEFPRPTMYLGYGVQWLP